MHKPYGYLSQFLNNQNTRRNKKLLGNLGNFPLGIMAIGRLDEKSEGLLLLTTDGKVSERIRSKLVEKEYYVQVKGILTEEAIGKLREGVIIAQKPSLYKTLPCKVQKIDEPLYLGPPHRRRDERHGPTSWVSMTITEGKFRQVRKMTAQVGFPTERLIRVRIGDIHLGEMNPGDILEAKSI
ncbi:pseudouridine synthase [Bacteroidia bacterium]|nr:pseudouridine synthase [Bacteroidia bacterium]MDB4107853.1 pseudouridine synthase [Bacteroidia bacterium]MDB9883311.1 pseudouridine synthase [Bacteroidia bacterium]MDC1395859.1 pseudouridine synthase [Bacteroidia bacterium]